MEIKLQLISFEHKNVLRNLMELCQHDYSEFSGDDINEHGLFDYRYLDNYWTESGRYPFFIRVSESSQDLLCFENWRQISRKQHIRWLSFSSFVSIVANELVSRPLVTFLINFKVDGK